MIHIAMVNKNTGDVCEDCNGCKVISVSSREDLDSQFIAEGHILIELTNEEINKYIEMRLYTENGEEKITINDISRVNEVQGEIWSENKFKIDMTKATSEIKDRTSDGVVQKILIEK